MSSILEDLIHVLNVEPLEVNLFRGESRDLGGRSVFGGQVLGQALMAAYGTVEDQVPHSIHAYFLRPGDMQANIVYEVERLRDGRSFVTRRIHAVQHGRPIFSMIVSFQSPEEGMEHQAEMPDVPGPEGLATQAELRELWVDDCPEKMRRGFMRDLAIEFKPVAPANPFHPEARPAEQHIWFKAAGSLPDCDKMHRCVLAYASDFNLLGTALRPHGVSWFSEKLAVASLDHVLWFHRPFKVDDWLLYSMDSPSASGARGLSRGQIFNQAGELVVSVAQESLMRRLD